jgi:hypothetical protein
VGHELAKRERYGRRWGLRTACRASGRLFDHSTGDLDISKAHRYGGGGHRNASLQPTPRSGCGFRLNGFGKISPDDGRGFSHCAIRRE